MFNVRDSRYVVMGMRLEEVPGTQSQLHHHQWTCHTSFHSSFVCLFVRSFIRLFYSNRI